MEDELHRWMGSKGINRFNVKTNEMTAGEPNVNKYYKMDSLANKYVGFEKYKYTSSKNFKQNVSFGSCTHNNEFSSNKLKNINYKERSEIKKTEFDSKQYVGRKDGSLKNKNEVMDDKSKNDISSKHDRKRRLNIPEDGNDVKFQKGLSREYEIEFDGFSIHIDESCKRARSDKNHARPKLKATQEQRRIHHKEYLDICKNFGINNVVTIHGRLYRVLIGTQEFILTKDELVNHIDVIPPQDPSFKLMFSYDDSRIKSIPP